MPMTPTCAIRPRRNLVEDITPACPGLRPVCRSNSSRSVGARVSAVECVSSRASKPSMRSRDRGAGAAGHHNPQRGQERSRRPDVRTPRSPRPRGRFSMTCMQSALAISFRRSRGRAVWSCPICDPCSEQLRRGQERSRRPDVCMSGRRAHVDAFRRGRSLNACEGTAETTRAPGLAAMHRHLPGRALHSRRPSPRIVGSPR